LKLLGGDCDDDDDDDEQEEDGDACCILLCLNKVMLLGLDSFFSTLSFTVQYTSVYGDSLIP
jgi:hypothetical protein